MRIDQPKAYPMRTDEDRRRYTRIDFANDAVLHQLNNRFSVHLVDISLKGVLLERPADSDIEPNTEAHIVITLTEEIVIEMLVKLIHRDGYLLGFHCDSIDVESMTHLRRLIELNIQVPNASERVLQELISPGHQENNRRREKRYPYRSPCSLVIGDKKFTADTLNISEHGALVAVQAEHSARPGESAHLSLDSEAEKSVNLRGQVAHASAHYIGLKCDETTEENLAHIRQLIAQKIQL